MGVNLSYLDFCERARPEWTPEDGVASSVLEFFIALNTPFGYIWVAALILLLWKRSILPGVLLIFVSGTLFAFWNTIRYNLVDDLYYGQLGGCVGSLDFANLVLVIAGLLGLGAICFSLYKRESRSG